MRRRDNPKFRVPNFRADNRKRVKDRWRRQRGLDNKTRVGTRGHGYRPKIGYKNNNQIRFTRFDGSFEKQINNEKELMELKGVAEYTGVLAHALSSRKKLALQKLADQNGIRIANRVKQ